LDGLWWKMDVFCSMANQLEAMPNNGWL